MSEDQFLLDPENPENPTEPTDPEEPGGGEELEGEDIPLKDVSGLFNERGIYKSNGFSFDEEEIINDFSGNLIYYIPLYNYKMGGDMSINMKMVYNGSVNHMVKVNDQQFVNALKNNFHMNSPEWIISLNGIAVQVLNFTGKFFSPPGSLNPAMVDGNEVSMLIPGYHYSSDNRIIDISNKDKITLLMGDGSTITLENKDYSGDNTNGDNYTGNYFYKGKGTFYRAVVEFIDTDPNIPVNYRRRRIKLLKGDGLEYIFEEDKKDYADFNGGSNAYRPLIPVLKRITDRFGYHIDLDYERHDVFYKGRDLLKTIYAEGFSSSEEPVRFNFYFYEYGGLIEHVGSSLNGSYTFHYEGSGITFNQDDLNNKTGRIDYIVNALGKRFSVEYEQILAREYTNIESNLGSGSLTLKFDRLKRIKNTVNYLGLKKEYEYIEPSNYSINLSTMLPSDHIMSSLDIFGYGRDPFFTNMVENRYEYEKNINGILEQKSTTNLIYGWDNGNRNDLAEHPILDSDILTTTRAIQSDDSETINSSADHIRRILEYRIYPLYDPNSHFAFTPDTDGETKLIAETIEDVTNAVILKVTEYEYDTGILSGGGYNGTFQTTRRKETLLNAESREWNYEYEYLEIDIGSNAVFKIPEKITETDPENLEKVSLYKYFYGNYLRYLFMNAHEMSTVPDTWQFRFYYYNPNVLEEEYYKSDEQPGELLNRKKFTFINAVNDPQGYIGQVIKDEIHENGSIGNIITDYKYYKLDYSEDEEVFDEMNYYPYKEGNLREIIRPNGEVTKYFYNPTEMDEVYIDPDTDAQNGVPYLRYFVLYNNGDKIEEWDKIWDHRFPIKIDRVKRYSSIDTLVSRTYKKYSLDGSPLKSMDENKMLTEFKYEMIHRIGKITLPGDFSHEPDGEYIITIDNEYEADLELKSNKWGFINLDNNEGYFAETLSEIGVQCRDFYSESIYNNPAHPNNKKYAAFMGFDFKSIGIPVSIERLDLNLKFYEFSQVLNGQPYSPKKALLRGVYDYITINGNCEGMSVPHGKLYTISGSSLISIISHPSNYEENLIDISNIYDNAYKGLLIIPIVELPENGYYYWFTITFVNGSVQSWYEQYAPSLIVEGTFNHQVIVVKPLYKGGTIRYIYDDNDNIIDVISLRSHNLNDYSKIRHYLDSYGNVRQKDILALIDPQTSAGTYNSFYSKFNYLNLPAINTDAAGNITKLSYDGLQRLIKTENADASFTITSYTYQGSLAGYFTNGYTGFIEKQAFTDENGNNFWKYFDALGNLRREVKFIILDIPQGPEEEILLDPLETDYLYDDLYRLVMVKTPAGKPIEYEYDGYGRQVQRETPDTGVVKFRYDDNNNLVFSQDENQRAGRNPNQIFTFRRYDALNRLTVLGENSLDVRDFLEIDPNTDDDFTDGDNPTDPYYDYLVVNVYDSLGTSPAAIFDPPSDYQPAQQNSYYYTKGRLAATAYRTRKTDTWSFKYYKYDERGRIIRMWHVIHGLGTKKIDYYYNSQDQITNLGVLSGEADLKSFRYLYDIPGRLSHLDLDLGTPTLQNPVQYFNLVKYLYNQNSLISSLGLNEDLLISTYAYTNRNWILNCYDNIGIFGYIMDYFPNGNVSWLSLSGSYNSGFSDDNNIEFFFSYDKSNRLLNATTNYPDNGYDLNNTYDKDGNILTLKRYAGDGMTVDNFTYTYYSGTNKLKDVSIQFNDFQYDANGNLILDDMNKNTEINYACPALDAGTTGTS